VKPAQYPGSVRSYGGEIDQNMDGQFGIHPVQRVAI
jgi:hypothetical protein